MAAYVIFSVMFAIFNPNAMKSHRMHFIVYINFFKVDYFMSNELNPLNYCNHRSVCILKP